MERVPTKEAPEIGYILPKWGMKNKERATAIAYMQREGLVRVQHRDWAGRFSWFFLSDLEASTGNPL